MATIRKRDDKWQIQVRKKGARAVSKSFFHRKDAEAWGRQRETDIDLGVPESTLVSGYTLGDLFTRYLTEITPGKKGWLAEGGRLRRLIRDPIARTPLAALDAPTLCTFRDRRVSDGVRACQYDLVLIRHALEIARKEWGLVTGINPVAQIRVPNGIKSRHRRLEAGEFEKLRTAASASRNPVTWSAVEFAIQTGMRRSELLQLKWGDVNLEERLALLHDTKNGRPRSVPLTKGAVSIIQRQSRRTERVFPTTECALRQGWERLVIRAEITGLRFHDLRHEAISRFFELGLSIPEVALISGHRDPKMLFRYTHLKPSDVAAKLHATLDGTLSC